VSEDDVPTLIDWAGGQEVITQLIDAFYDRVEADELLSPFFPGGVSQQHRRHVSLWWTERCWAAPPSTPIDSVAMSGCSTTTAGWRSPPSNDCDSPPL